MNENCVLLEIFMSQHKKTSLAMSCHISQNFMSQHVVSHDYCDIPSKYSVIEAVQHSSVPVDLKKS